MIFFSDMYNLIYYKMYKRENDEEKNSSKQETNTLIYNGWKDYLIIKNDFLSDISNIIFDYQMNYKNSPSHSQLKMKDKHKNQIESKLSNNYVSIGIDDNSNDFYYMCNCNETLRRQIQTSLSKLVKYYDKEWTNHVSIVITHEISYLLNRIKHIKNEDIYFDIYDDIENQTSKSEILKIKIISTSKLLYNSIYDIVFNTELIKKYNSENYLFCKYCGEENGIIIDNKCYDCYLYIEESNDQDIV